MSIMVTVAVEVTHAAPVGAEVLVQGTGGHTEIEVTPADTVAVPAEMGRECKVPRS
jgi:hypothetical protein